MSTENTPRCLAIFLLTLLFVLRSAVAGVYSYNTLGQYVGGYIHNLYMHDAIAMHCPISSPPHNVKDEEALIAWAARFFSPEDRQQAMQGLRSSLPDLRNQAYGQARNIFVGFSYKSKIERDYLCQEVGRSVAEGERENLDGVRERAWRAK